MSTPTASVQNVHSEFTQESKVLLSKGSRRGCVIITSVGAEPGGVQQHLRWGEMHRKVSNFISKTISDISIVAGNPSFF
jgi:hypothetical protein